MWKESLKLTATLIVFITMYYVLSIFIDDRFIVIIVVIISIPIVIYNIKTKGSFEYRVEVLCDANTYLTNVETKYKNKEESEYYTYLAYAYIHQGAYDSALSSIHKVDKEKIVENKKLSLMYYMVLLKLAYNNNDLDSYSSLFAEIKKVEQDEKSKIEDNVFDVPLLMLEGRYLEAIDMLIDIIPRQRKRSLILELEYYLGLAYYKVNKYEDARAVLEFMSKKRYRLIYIEMCRELLEKLPEPKESTEPK